MTHDPIGYVGGVNLFEYVGGNPVRFVDPEGAEPITISSGIGLIDLAIGSGAIVAGEVLLPAIAGVGLGAIVYCQIDPEGCAAMTKDLGNFCGDLAGTFLQSKIKGERGQTGNISGTRTNNPYKHCKPIPGRPGWIRCKDNHSGKTIDKPAPPDYEAPNPWPMKK